MKPEYPIMSSPSPDERSVLIDEIIAMESELATLKSQEQKSRQRIGRTARLTNRAFLYILLGPRLTKRLGALLHSAKEKKEPILGTRLAKVLDSASRRMTGYKRWIVIFGLIAALPGIISLILLWQQNEAVERETLNTIADIENRARLDLLLTIYTSEEKDPDGAMITPSYPASLRSEAALELIKMDSQSYRNAEKELGEPFLWRVDLSQAPLARVNFSSPDPDETQAIQKTSFISSNFYRASFHHCQLVDVWFDSATLIQTNFRKATLTRVTFPGAMLFSVDFTGATFEECDFKGAKYNTLTRWPKGFDPVSAGAILINPNGEGASQ